MPDIFYDDLEVGRSSKVFPFLNGELTLCLKVIAENIQNVASVILVNVGKT